MVCIVYDIYDAYCMYSTFAIHGIMLYITYNQHFSLEKVEEIKLFVMRERAGRKRCDA